MHLDHLCRVRSCVNPAHLEPVTNAENCRRGANAKLTAADVRAIRQRVAGGEEIKAIAARFDVSVWTIYLIRNGKTWVGV
jgi:hypothetical protein